MADPKNPYGRSLAQREKIAAEIASIPAKARYLAALRKSIDASAAALGASDPQVINARTLYARLYADLRALNDEARRAWKSAAGIAAPLGPEPPTVDIDDGGGMAGLVPWVSIGLGVALIVAAFVSAGLWPVVAVVSGLAMLAAAAVSLGGRARVPVPIPSPGSMPSGVVNAAKAGAGVLVLLGVVVGGLYFLSRRSLA